MKLQLKLVDETKVEEDSQVDQEVGAPYYSGRTKYSALVSKLNKLSEEYLSPQKTQKATVFFIRKILDRRMI